ncbi:SLC45A1 [Branchiostoma lanceolatum]|uniref:SLC45A1 protein n=1 Tax=Branchiostoma lanceolatum TaxID=7740 RepID=A0A8J9WH68_BRALA|nr:SLC45A1 [Branchiostoma lanceolatum]
MSMDETTPLIPAPVARWQPRPQKHFSTKTIGHKTNLGFKPGVRTKKPRHVFSYRLPPPPPPTPVAFTLPSEEGEEPPKRSLWQLLANGGIMFGVEFCYALEMALVTPILLQLGVPEEYYTFIWFISPVLGFLVQPILGSWSDRCTAQWGRRRPFILALSVGILVGTALMLNGEDIANATFRDSQTATYGAIVLTILGNVMLDFCADSSDSPSRAYLLDTCCQDDQDRGLSLHALMGGLGGGVGYVVGGVDWDQTILTMWVGSGQRVVFTFAAVSFVLSAIVTLFSIKEIPLEKQDKMDGSSGPVDNRPVSVMSDVSSICSLTPTTPLTTPVFSYGAVHSVNQNQSADVLHNHQASNDGNASANSEDDTVPDLKQFQTKTRKEQKHMVTSSYRPLRRTRSMPGDEIANMPKYVEEEKYFTDGYISEDEIRENPQGGEQTNSVSRPSNLDITDDDDRPRSVSFSEEVAALLQGKANGTTQTDSRESMDSDEEDDVLTVRMLYMAIIKMPNVLKRLCFCHFLGWVAMEAILMFFTDFVGRTVFHGSPTAELGTTPYENYDSGVKMGCWGLCIYAFSSAIYSALLDPLLDAVSVHSAYFFGYLMFSIAAALCVMFPNIYVVLSMCVAFGIMFATICTLPYTVLSDFHQNAEFIENSPGSSKRGFGLDTSLLSCQIFLAQIVNAACLGPLISVTGTVNAVLLFCSAVGFVGCFWNALFVVYELPGKDEDMEEKIQPVAF